MTFHIVIHKMRLNQQTSHATLQISWLQLLSAIANKLGGTDIISYAENLQNI